MNIHGKSVVRVMSGEEILNRNDEFYFYRPIRREYIFHKLVNSNVTTAQRYFGQLAIKNGLFKIIKGNKKTIRKIV
jgi:hypothetical protein